MFIDYLIISIQNLLNARISPLSRESPLNPLWIVVTIALAVLIALYYHLKNNNTLYKFNPLKSVKELIGNNYLIYRYFGQDLLYWLVNLAMVFILILISFSEGLHYFWQSIIPYNDNLDNILNIDWRGSEFMRKLVFSFSFFLIQDFIQFYSHKLLHEVDYLWRLHKIHHLPDQISPLTFARIHPLEMLFRITLMISGTSIFMIVIHPLLNLNVQFYILNAPLFWFINNIYNNFSHSHYWWHWGKISCIFRSPAMHLIHHQAKHNRSGKNYGNFFSIWDIMFNSLLIPSKKEPLCFGVIGETPPNSFIKSLLSPFKSK